MSWSYHLGRQASQNQLIWAVNQFSNYLSARTQSVHFNGSSSVFLPVLKGVSQGSRLRPLLFSIYINNHGNILLNAASHFYADDSHLMFFSVRTTQCKHLILWSAFDVVQSQPIKLNLVLNADKSKFMLLSNGKELPPTLPKIITTQGIETEMVTSF